MMIQRTASAGTLESSDIQVTIRPHEGLQFYLESPVKQRYQEQIIKTVKEVLDEHEIKDAQIQLTDHGALDCVIRARVLTAIMRSIEE